MLHSRLRIALRGSVALIAAAVALAIWWVHRPLPTYAGSLSLPALERPVSVRYSAHAVPSIRAESLEDMVVAQGFVVARERLWQMDLLRRLAGGRLAEVFGERALVADRFYRTIGLPRAAQRTYEGLEPRWRDLLRGYAQGVNAYRARAVAEKRLPLEYQLLRREPTPWRPQDSLLIGAYMAWLNASNLREELVFLRIAGRLGTERALELFPTAPGVPAPESAQQLPDYRLPSSGAEAAENEAPGLDNRSGTVSARLAVALTDREAALSTLEGALLGLVGPGSTLSQAASNAWAVTGEHSADGALLANDPHLPAQLPSPWYELEMQAPGYHAAGAALPGVPWILIGHNGALAWGITAAAADTQDLFLERTSDDGRAVLRPDGRPEPIQVRTEWIRVAGREHPARLDIRSTRHGVLIDELVAAPDTNPAGLTTVQRPERLALRTTLSEADRAMAALFRLNQAETIEEARAAVLGLQQVSLNFLYAHRNGRIAWQVSGRLPKRGRGSGTFPRPAWEVGYGWGGFRLLTENPGVSDPPSQRLLNANNAMPESQASPPISHSWLAPFRAWRIAALLDAEKVLDAAGMAQMQSDRVSEEAQLYLSALRRQMPSLIASAPEAAALAQSRLLSWNGRFDGASEPAAFFVMLRPALYRALYGDELGEDLDALMSLEQVTYGPLAETMRDDRSSFWDDVRTEDEREGPAAIWARALLDTERSLQAAGFADASPTLAQLRRLTFEHALGGQPLLGWLFNVGPLGHGGDNGTIDVAIAPQTRPREIGNVPSLRVVFTPGDWSRTRGTLPLGQSGHRFSRFWADQLDDWLGGRFHPWPWDGPAGQSLGTLTLRPAAG